MNPRCLRNLTDEEISHLLSSRFRVERVKANVYLTRMGHDYYKELFRLPPRFLIDDGKEGM